jgi:hypothetical protein
VKDVFERHIPAKLQAKPDVVAKINAIYQFNISGPGGGTWAVDCTQPGGKVSAGAVPNARCTVAATDQYFLSRACSPARSRRWSSPTSARTS